MEPEAVVEPSGPDVRAGHAEMDRRDAPVRECAEERPHECAPVAMALVLRKQVDVQVRGVEFPDER